MGFAFPAHGYRPRHADAWTLLLSELKPDLALVQEVDMSRLSEACAAGRAVRLPTSDGSETGSAIVCRAGTLEALTQVTDGATVIAARYDSAGESLVVVSAHVVTSGDPATGRSQHRVLRDLGPWLNDVVGDGRFVIGGDFNASRCWPEFNAFFGDVAARGFHDCHHHLHGREARSFWGRKPEVVRDPPIQDDHVFVDAETGRRVTKCWIEDDSSVWPLSDHGPLIVDLAEP